MVSPPDPAMLADAAAHGLVVTAEDGVRTGGAGTFLADALAQLTEADGQPTPAVHALGVPRAYLVQGRADDILASLGLDGPGIARSIRGSWPRTGARSTGGARDHPVGAGVGDGVPAPAAGRPGRPTTGRDRSEPRGLRATPISPCWPHAGGRVVHRVVGVDRLAGVTPEALEHVEGHRALVDVVVVDVGDLELPPPEGSRVVMTEKTSGRSSRCR